MTTLNTLLKKAKKKFDLTEPADQESLYALTSALLKLQELAPESLQETARQSNTPIEFKLAAKLVDSMIFSLIILSISLSSTSMTHL